MEQSAQSIAVTRAPCIAYGVPFVLQASEPELLARMLGCVPHGTLPDDRADPSAGIFALSGRYSLSTPEGPALDSPQLETTVAVGLVHPHARDLQMREPGRPEQKSLTVAELSGCAGVEALPVAQVVFARYVPGGAWQPQPLSAGLAVLEMLRHSIPVQRTPARVMATLAAMMEPATAWRSERGDAADTARMLLAGMDA